MMERKPRKPSLTLDLARNVRKTSNNTDVLKEVQRKMYGNMPYMIARSVSRRPYRHVYPEQPRTTCVETKEEISPGALTSNDTGTLTSNELGVDDTGSTLTSNELGVDDTGTLTDDTKPGALGATSDVTTKKMNNI
uniref:Uncharacterized protein n=1 Tax=Chionoecetes opilio bacilliform virus TaxID=1825681 RepID=A0A1Q3DLF6_9VIRU|nr:hypothetical protein SCV_039 [Chionoecetes opilio bacilliform virus]